MAKQGSYYPHIDALRAFAVLTVILFHINHEYLPGGFIGVDVFFVISGFLITSHIMQSVSAGQFSLKDFYARRIKRILPAAFSVIIITVILAQYLFLPEDAIQVAKSGFWSALSLPNVYFWKFQDTSYFAASSYTIPLLHYWSLGVEEQFYLIWPLVILVLLGRIPKVAFIALIIFTIVLSASIAEWLISTHHSFVYYMLPTRAGELLVGGLLAALMHFGWLQKRANSHFLLYFSIVLLVGSSTLIDSNVTFPGFLYLIPTVGAALFIYSGFENNSPLLRFFTSKPILWVGKVSYSAYLVHWPVLAFYRYGYGSPSLFAELLLFVVILSLAWLNWKWIEEKFRYKKLEFKPLVIKQFLAPILCIGSLSFAVIKTDGLGLRVWSDSYHKQLSSTYNHAKAPNSYDYVCQYWRVEAKHLTDPKCIIGNDKFEPNVLLWGDSNAAHYIGILGQLAKSQGWSFRNISHASCPPIVQGEGVDFTESLSKDCSYSNNVVNKYIAQYDTVILSAFYTYYQDKNPQFVFQFLESVRKLSETKNVIILGQIPSFPEFDRQCLSKQISYLGLDCHSLKMDNSFYSINEELKDLSIASRNIEYQDFNNIFCQKDSCSPYIMDRPVYYDSTHLDIKHTSELELVGDFELLMFNKG
ncbi:acyltransferase [Psychrosphaera ytuae]|uniref:Acyltransferase n=1 Tax=Psychrosphaera ytuae TaxID=2820710 RepID=A0A975HHH2_9GAMM|nr:acyltransferase family protein [Psychrosphaera ytuae]QTH63120.1 acyltransferase [Psychrosphaera ytuae]